MAERVEASRLHERLDSSLVERARIDPATEVVEVDERALTLAGGDDVLDNGLPDIADRGKAEDDHLPATRAEASAVERIVVKFEDDAFTSGTRTSIPSVRHSAR